MACTTGCPTQTCDSYAACLRGKGVKVAYCNSASGQDFTAQKQHDSELDLYREARAQGIQPSGTKREQTENALRISDATGTPFQAG